MSYRLVPALVIAAALPASAQVASPKYGTLLARIPDQSNLLLLVDVGGLFESPLGKSERWREKAAARSGWFGLADDITRLVVAAGADYYDQEISWRVGMAQLRDGLPDVATLAAREGGFVEEISQTKVAWTPRGFYLVTYKPDILGFVTPATRQAMARWITTTFVKPRSFPPGFADRAIYRADRDSQVVLALNLEQATSPQLLEPWLTTLDGLKEARLDPKLLSETLATVKSAMFQVDVKESIRGTIVVEFGYDVNYAKPVAKALVLTALEEYGVALDEVKAWAISADGRTITGSGRLSEASVRRLLSLAAPPRLTPGKPSDGELAALDPAKAAKVAAKYDKPDVVKASQAYFHSVSDALNDLKHQRSESYRGMKVWYERYAKQIEELPILGVDKDLLDWGAKVARTLREMAYGINDNVQTRKYARSTSGGGYYGGYGVYVASNAPQEAIRQQGEAMLSVGLDARWQVLETAVSDMRRTLVERYMVDF